MPSLRFSASKTLVAASLLSLFAASCASTRHSADQDLSGFLTNYDLMARSDDSDATFWADPSFDLDSFDAVWVQKVELWDASSQSGGEVGEMATDDAKRLAGMFREKTVAELGKQGWDIATGPGPRVLGIRMALTELDGANRFGSVLTSVPYMTTPAIQLMSAATDVHVFVGQASTELQITDSDSGKILAEAYDRRVGAHSLGNIGSTWGDVEDAIKVFAKRLAKGLSKTAQ